MLQKYRKEAGIYRKIIGINLKHNFLGAFAAAICIWLLTAKLFNITSLQGRAVAQPIEFLLCFMGVMLLTPIFLPEQNREICDVICSKKISYLKICGIRVIYSAAALLLLEGVFVGLMYLLESRVTWQHFIGGTATALFLGAIGLAVAGLSDNTIAGYMMTFVYYLANYGLKQKLGVFNLFSMYMGSFEEKWWQLGGGIVLIIMTFVIIRKKK